jgi:hypothetical protein
MENTTEKEPGKVRPVFVLMAWGSPAIAAVVAIILYVWFDYIHEGHRGVRSDSVLAFYLGLLGVNAIASLGGIASLFGICSGRGALILVPGAVLGVISNVFLGVGCLFSYLLEGKNMGG